jgi:hypothetical protein
MFICFGQRVRVVYVGRKSLVKVNRYRENINIFTVRMRRKVIPKKKVWIESLINFLNFVHHHKIYSITGEFKTIFLEIVMNFVCWVL